MSLKAASLHELSTVYSLRDAHDLLEIVLVDAHNRRAAAEAAKARNGSES